MATYHASPSSLHATPPTSLPVRIQVWSSLSRTNDIRPPPGNFIGHAEATRSIIGAKM